MDYSRPMSSRAEKYTRVAVILHWILALLIIGMVLFGEDLIGKRDGTTFSISAHASFGIAIMGLSVLRVLWRLANAPPPHPATMKQWELTASKIIHGLFYAMMFLVPATGLLAFPYFASESAAATNATLFGIVPVPLLHLVDGWNFGQIHELGTKALYPLIALHVLAALKHQFIDRDGILKRMT
jgi:cytochrome b561